MDKNVKSERTRLEVKREHMAQELEALEAKLEELDNADERAARAARHEEVEAQCAMLQEALLRALRTRREQLEWTQAELAQRLDTSAKAFGPREQGKKPPGQRALVQWARVLGYCVELVDERGERWPLTEESDELAALLRARREAKDWSIQQLAHKIGVSASQQGQREQGGGTRGYTLSTLLAWITALGLELVLTEDKGSPL